MLDFMPTIVLAAIAIFIGFVGLVWSADRFVAGAASIAEAFGIAPVIIGLTIVSLGTSAPEIMVSLMAALRGAGDMAVGNALGSNIANIGLVLGVTTLISRIPVQWHLLKQEGFLLLLITLLAGYFLWDFTIHFYEGIILLVLLVPTIWYIAVVKQKEHSSQVIEEEEELEHYKPLAAWIWFIAGLTLLVLSSKMLVWGAQTTAEYFHVSPLVIGLTVLAIGTSLPELAASVMSAIRGHHDIAVGNIIGSNIFNLLAVMSIPGLVGSPTMEPEVFSRDYLIMLGLTLLLGISIAIVLMRSKTPQLGRITGVLLLSSFVGYILLVGQSQL